MVGLVAGVAISARTDVWERPGVADAAPTAPDLQAGSLQMSEESGEHGPLFDLQLLNHRDEAVTVTGLAFDNLLGDVAEVELAPGGWEAVRFAAPPDCTSGVPPILRSVRVTLEGADGGFEREVELPGKGSTLVDYHKAACASAGPPPRRELVGIWMLDDSFRPLDELEKSMLWQFQRDGTFVADPEGVLLFDEQRAMQGRYFLRRGRLVIERDGSGYADQGGQREVWRATIISDVTEERVPLMTLTLIGGSDSDDSPGMVWVMRRIIDGTDTPGAIG